ncbi:hypothetical protein [Legionella pneumophila]
MKFRFSFKIAHIFYCALLLSPLSTYSEVCHIDHAVSQAPQGQVNVLGIDVNTLEIFFYKEGLPSNSTIFVYGDRVNCQLIPTEIKQPGFRGNYPKMRFNIVVFFGNKEKYEYSFFLSSPLQVKCKVNSKLNCNVQEMK